MQTNVSQPNATSVQAQEELCKAFIRLVRKNYKRSGIHHFTFVKLGDHFHFRARWHRRRLWAFSSNLEMAMARFMLEISSKVFLEKYYDNEEFKKIKEQLRERVILSYAIKELPQS